MVQAKAKLLWVAEGPVPAALRRAAGEAGIECCRPGQPLKPQLEQAAVAVIHPNGDCNDSARMAKLLFEIEHASAVVLFMLPPEHKNPRIWKMLTSRRGQHVCVSEESSPAELSASINAVMRLQSSIGQLRQELTELRASGASNSDELNEEMRLAARLQRDFLPRRLPEVGPIRFAVLYRPLGWVSGDIYDIARLDENHVGFYVADAVGHGMPAALLTMFIKKALQTKRIIGNSYQIVPPQEALTELNDDICRQSLSSCQFCTAAYCVINVQNLTMTCARAGHPEPLLVRPGGKVEKVEAQGSLLGIFEQEKYAATSVQLAPGDRLIVYSDGAEPVLMGPEGLDAPWREHISREEFILALTARIESAHDLPPDDMTVLVLDVLENPSPARTITFPGSR